MAEITQTLALLGERLKTGELTCIVQKGDRILTSRQRGVRPLLDWIAQEKDLHGACAADRIVGKAAALLYALMGVKGVFAEVISTSGLAVLQKYGICAEYATLTPNIMRRGGNGLCPMEQTVLAIEDPSAAYAALAEKAEQLQKRHGNTEEVCLKK